MNKFIHVSFYTNEDQNQEVIIEATKQEFFLVLQKILKNLLLMYTLEILELC